MQTDRSAWGAGVPPAASKPFGARSFAGLAAALASVAALDWFSGAEIAAALAYLLPIGWTAWRLGNPPAYLVAVACTAAWLVVDVGSHPGMFGTTEETVNTIVLAVAFLLAARLLATLRSQIDQLRELAHTDPMTGLVNRRGFWDATERELARLQRHGGAFSIAYLDVDDFKGVNDRHGHAAGDALLRSIAGVLAGGRRRPDVVARLGGDEFAILLPATGASGAAKFLHRLDRRLRGRAWRSDYGIDFSIGCLTVEDPPASVEEVVARADALMYAAKRCRERRVVHEVLGGAGDVGHRPTLPAVGPMPA